MDTVEHIIAVAKKAAQAILKIYQNNSYEVKWKADASPVTEADVAAHDIIAEGLRQIDPSLPILSEEGRYISFEERSTWQRFWLVDPLDGTKEFIKKTGEFTVNIALVADHIPVTGVVIAPFLHHVYWAVRGEGAFFQIGDEPASQIRANRQVSFPIKVAMSRYHPEEKAQMLPSLLKRLKEVEIVYCGSALKICLVARGVVDLYPRFGPTGEWDTAAGQCILEAAGGQITDLQGQSLKYNSSPSLVNPGFVAFSCAGLLPYIVDKSN